jgi:hypothetical protein
LASVNFFGPARFSNIFFYQKLVIFPDNGGMRIAMLPGLSDFTFPLTGGGHSEGDFSASGGFSVASRSDAPWLPWGGMISIIFIFYHAKQPSRERKKRKVFSKKGRSPLM